MTKRFYVWCMFLMALLSSIAVWEVQYETSSSEACVTSSSYNEEETASFCQDTPSYILSEEGIAPSLFSAETGLDQYKTKPCVSEEKRKEYNYAIQAVMNGINEAIKPIIPFFYCKDYYVFTLRHIII